MNDGDHAKDDKKAATRRLRRCCSANSQPPMAATIKVLTSRTGAIWLTGATIIAVRMRMYEIGFRIVTPKSAGLFCLL
jgi:hypothetical protein